MPVTGWGRVIYPAWPGQYHVQVFVPCLILPRVGPADYAVMVHAGQVVELEYKVPLWTFSRGSLGPPPQAYNGAALIIGIAGASVVVIVIVIALIMMFALILST